MASSIAFAAINPTAWFEVTARDLADIGNQQLRWPALVQIVAEPRGVPRKPYVFAGVCPDSTPSRPWPQGAYGKNSSPQLSLPRLRVASVIQSVSLVQVRNRLSAIRYRIEPVRIHVAG